MNPAVRCGDREAGQTFGSLSVGSRARRTYPPGKEGFDASGRLAGDRLILGCCKGIRMDPEECLAKRIGQQEEDAVREFVDTYLPSVMGFLMALRLPPSDAKEIAVSAITDSVLKMDHFTSKGEHSLRNWVFAVARHLMCDWLRQKGPPGDSIEIEKLVDVRAAREASCNDWFCPAQEVLDRAFAELNPREQTCVFMRMLRDPYPFAEVGERIGVTEGNARVIFNRAMAKLRRRSRQSQSAPR